MEDLTGRQREILDLIRTTVADRGYPPSVREIGDALGLRSPSTVHSHLSSLVRAGYLRRDPAKPRAIEVIDPAAPSLRRSTTRDVPLIGRIAAGAPILAEEQIEEVLTLPTEFTGQGPVFLLRVRGDSMLGAGILDGDYVVVRSQNVANNGEIVAALVDGEEATVKRFSRRDGQVVLIPENPAYQEMVFTEGIQILGKVVAVLRTIG
ncbi:lexA repressor [bacterium BMS3Abin02]|nr:lexA repressor [bacterium BMS3Abin02]GBE21712.1 lexA repressor [bacterium BMS3Bbin01]HDH27364.1 transcriptional repressor LexA [Actinomycetota bacterium]HDK45375.1 transcriptional repressor LexA [Actinomycetota bacterium]HDL48880.1 transcriptional repressor LexA [Actinomycetota bacterium]